MKIDSLVHDKVLAIVRLRRPTVSRITEDQELRGDLELDSLDLAQLGAEIEAALGMPIFDEVAVGAILTVGDLTAVCEECFAAMKEVG